MLVKVKETKTVEVETVKDVLCNKCGKSCLPDEDVQDAYGLIEATVTGGFLSPALGDMTRYVFSICEPCLAELFKTFVHDPFVPEVSDEGPEGPPNAVEP